MLNQTQELCSKRFFKYTYKLTRNINFDQFICNVREFSLNLDLVDYLLIGKYNNHVTNL